MSQHNSSFLLNSCLKLIFFLRDGRIKLFGKDNAQVLLESREPVPSKFLQVIFPFFFLTNFLVLPFQMAVAVFDAVKDFIFL